MKKENVEYLILVGLFPIYLALMSLSLLSGSAFSMLVLIGVCGGYLFVVLVANLVFLFLRRDRYEESEAVLDKFRQTEKGGLFLSLHPSSSFEPLLPRLCDNVLFEDERLLRDSCPCPFPSSFHLDDGNHRSFPSGEKAFRHNGLRQPGP